MTPAPVVVHKMKWYIVNEAFEAYQHACLRSHHNLTNLNGDLIDGELRDAGTIFLHNLLKLCVILKRWPCVVFLHKSLNLSPSQFAPAPCLSPSGIPSRHGHQGHRRCHPHPETFKGGGRKDADRQSPRVRNVVVVVGGHEALDVGRRRHRRVKKRRW